MRKDTIKLIIIPFFIILSSVLFFLPKNQVDLSDKTYGTFQNNSTKKQTLYTLRTDNEILNELIKEYETPKDETTTEIDYTSKLYFDNFVQIEFQHTATTTTTYSILFNLERNQLAKAEDFFTSKAIRYLTYEKQQALSVNNDYSQYILDTTIENHELSLKDENTLIIGSDTYILSESDRYTQANQEFPDVAINVPVDKKLIAFTFDDGPHTGNTQRAMDVLETYNGQGTFFIMGPRAKQFPEIIKEILNRNHQIASHSYNHKNFTKISNEELEFEIYETEEIVQTITGNDAMLMVRPPYGAINEHVKNTIQRTYINWNIDSDDWRKLSPMTICETIVSTSKQNGIVLMHDLYDDTIEAFSCAAQRLHEEGYQFVSVDTLLKANNIDPEVSKVYYNGNKG